MTPDPRPHDVPTSETWVWIVPRFVGAEQAIRNDLTFARHQAPVKVVPDGFFLMISVTATGMPKTMIEVHRRIQPIIDRSPWWYVRRHLKRQWMLARKAFKKS